MKSLSLTLTMLVLLSYAYLGTCAPNAGSLQVAQSGARPAVPLNPQDNDGHHGMCCDCSAVSLDHCATVSLPRLEPSGLSEPSIVPTFLKLTLRQIDPPPRAAFV